MNAAATGPTVTIVTPGFDDHGALDRARASIRAQTYTNVEHLVAQGRDEAAINAGLKQARGEILAVVGCNEWLPRWAVEVAVAAMLEDPSLDLVYGDAVVVDPRLWRQRIVFAPPLDIVSLSSFSALVTPATYFRRRVYEELGALGDRQAFLGDVEGWLRSKLDVSWRHVDEVLGYQLATRASMSVADARQVLRQDNEAWHERATRQSAIPLALRRLLARFKRVLWWRRAWLRFLGAIFRSSPGGPWHHFIAGDRPRVQPLRVALMFIPRLGSRFAWDAFRSARLAASLDEARGR